MGSSVDDGEGDNGPSNRFMEGNVLVEGDKGVEGSSADQGDEVSADRKEDESSIQVENERGRTSDRISDTKGSSGGNPVIL